jgi:CelD/BcsL family acetyltransferase involved in cellulose biosynthesis
VAAGGHRTAEGTTELRLEPVATPESLRDEWDSLVEASRNIFSSWEWAETWWRHFGQGRRRHVTACRSADGDLVAILPLYYWSERLGIIRFIGHDAGDQLGPVCASDDSTAAARALSRLLEQPDFRWNLFVGDWLPGNEEWGTHLRGKVLRAEGSPFLRLDAGSWEDLSGRWSRERRNIRRRERKLRSEHDVTLRLADDPERLAVDLDQLFALHAARWTSSSPFSQQEAFHRDFARRALERGWLRLWLLEVDGRAIGAQYGFRFAGVESGYQGGWAAEWARFGPGMLMCTHAIKHAYEDGALEYRFLRGDEDYKHTFAQEDNGIVTIGVTRGLRGRALLNAARAGRRLRLRG